jgi:hypothetical protein
MGRIMVVLALLAGCTESDDDGDGLCSIQGLTGVGSATLDGMDWAANGGSWNPTGGGIQIVLESAIDVGMTIRATRDESGVDVMDLIEDAAFPIVVSLTGDDGTGNIRDARNQQVSYASGEPGGSGSLSILSVSGATMAACFSFVALSEQSVMMEVTNGKVEIEER